MASGLLLIRLVLGLTMAAHGSQKLFRWFDGPGLRGLAGYFGSMRLRPAFLMAVLAGLSEFVGGLLFAAGLVTPLDALGIAIVMVMAVATVHWPKGFFNGNGGFEFNLLIWTGAVAVAAIGPGRFSLDHAFGWDDNLSGFRWGVGVAVVSLVVGGLILATRSAAEPATQIGGGGEAPTA
jgi:putative oxidoreductase